MLRFIVDYGVPAGSIFLMFVVGSAIERAHFVQLLKAPAIVALGSVGQLVAVPLVGLAVARLVDPVPAVATGLVLLSICPGGGISNYFTYVARSNVLLSAAITTVATVASLVTIPFWVWLLPAASFAAGAPLVAGIIAQLFLLMILPIAAGVLVRAIAPRWTQANAGRLRLLSLATLGILLVLTVAAIPDRVLALAPQIAVVAPGFILGAMLVGRIMGARVPSGDRPVLVIEAGVRNIGVALILGNAVFGPEEFPTFAALLAGYFAIEVVIMLAYATAVGSSRPVLPVPPKRQRAG